MNKTDSKSRYVFSVFFCLGYFYIPNQGFDLSRYYDFYNEYDDGRGLIESVEEVINYNFDFVYFLALIILKKIGFGPNLANGFFVGLYYGIIVSLVHAISKSRSKNIILWSVFLSVFSVPIIFSLSISRTVASLAFFFLALRFQVGKKPLLSLVMLLASIFTHIGMIVFIIPTFMLLKMTPHFAWRRSYLYIYLIVFLLCLSSSSWMNNVLAMFSSISFFEQYARYSIYLEQTTAIFSDLAYYDFIPIAWVLCSGVFMFSRIKFHSTYTLVCGFLLLVFALSINYSTLFSQRTVMFISPFFVILFVELQKQSIRKYYGLSTSGAAIVFISFATYVINLIGYRAYLIDSF